VAAGSSAWGNKYEESTPSVTTDATPTRTRAMRTSIVTHRPPSAGAPPAASLSSISPPAEAAAAASSCRPPTHRSPQLPPPIERGRPIPPPARYPAMRERGSTPAKPAMPLPAAAGAAAAAAAAGWHRRCTAAAAAPVIVPRRHPGREQTNGLRTRHLHAKLSSPSLNSKFNLGAFAKTPWPWLDSANV